MSYAEIKFSQAQRGGRRPGSGRKKLHHVPLMLHISAQADQALRLAAERSSSTPSRVIEQLIKESLKQDLSFKQCSRITQV